MNDDKDLKLSLEIVMTKENVEDLHSRFFMEEDEERWPVCKTMWCCRKCSEERGFSLPCKCSEMQVTTEEGELAWLPTYISCYSCGATWKPSELTIWDKKEK